MSIQSDFEEAVGKIERVGINKLMEYLAETDFYTAPCSTRFHGVGPQGLLVHSLSVNDVALALKDMASIEVPEESVRICALFHDICKVNLYVKEKRNKKIDGKWTEVEVWGVDDKLPMGHGEKSVYILQKFIVLTDEEALAIRWHLGGFDPGIHFNYPSGYPNSQAFRQNKLVGLLAGADLVATYLLDPWEEE